MRGFRPARIVSTSSPRRRLRTLLFGLAIFALAAWWWVWMGVFKRAKLNYSSTVEDDIA